jgi:hypothetical protein
MIEEARPVTKEERPVAEEERPVAEEERPVTEEAGCGPHTLLSVWWSWTLSL